ncbi:hypothetical protein BZB76_5375 [Actinomadura pelletieri DSM 43383]|uniref:ABC transporter n=1 Tax=Actinomadura pelletieri DSM 43383 TaxID=1120940 RepID=A0A495QG88_9ACTN|nr:hypothetical protein [Actinomadura pelletieri]RKS70895.1 hypothetical protein BZB76_5375 [Actinomadura pelletieri DSM 43383]
MRGRERTVFALYRYSFTGFVLSQRYAAPALLFCTAVVVGTSADSGPLIGAYSLCAMFMFLCAIWLTATLVNSEDPVQRGVTIVSAGGSARPLAATAAVAVTCCALLTVFGAGYPAMTGKHVVTATGVAVGAGAQLTTAAVGVAVGLVCSRPVIARQGYAVAAAVSAALAAVLVPWLTPVRPTVQLLLSDRSPEDVASPLLALALVATLLLTASVVATNTITTRRN